MSRILLYNFSNTDSYSGSGTTVTDLEENSNATLVNGPTFGIGSCGNNYLEFDGTNDYLITNTDLNPFLSPANSSTVISLFTWVYLIENGVIVSEQGTTTPDSAWFDSQIELVNGTMCFGVWPYSLGVAPITSSIETALNQWHYVGLAYNGTTLKAYVNGQQCGEATYARSTPNQNGSELHYAIGYGTSTNMSNSNNFAKIRLGTFEVYNTALDSNTIENNYNTSVDFWRCLEHKLTQHGGNQLTNRGDRFTKNTKRFFKNILHRLPGSAYRD